MPKEFFTERDIEDMFKRGIMSLQVTDNVVLTDLAYEKANRLGLKLVRDKPENPPAAPVRPYMKLPAVSATALPHLPGLAALLPLYTWQASVTQIVLPYAAA